MKMKRESESNIDNRANCYTSKFPIKYQIYVLKNVLCMTKESDKLFEKKNKTTSMRLCME